MEYIKMLLDWLYVFDEVGNVSPNLESWKWIAVFSFFVPMIVFGTYAVAKATERGNDAGASTFAGLIFGFYSGLASLLLLGLVFLALTFPCLGWSVVVLLGLAGYFRIIASLKGDN
jgi:hypothetical protein